MIKTIAKEMENSLLADETPETIIDKINRWGAMLKIGGDRTSLLLLMKSGAMVQMLANKVEQLEKDLKSEKKDNGC